ncbi:MAG: YhcH/YjgK/YiaL family protein [Paludibacteraceae bacterium]|nr:YhcH/YjgK/YiaL family protein [Paludibacteraceae bacterium]
MILDKLENADLYFEVVPRFREFMEFYNANDLEELPACKLKLQGDDLFVNIMDFTGKEEKDCKMESHRDYIDIQIPVNGDEMMGWKAQEDCQQVASEYNEDKDMALYNDPQTATIMVPKGHFVVFFPSDGHRPGIAPGKKYRKLIVKTRVVE